MGKATAMVTEMALAAVAVVVPWGRWTPRCRWRHRQRHQFETHVREAPEKRLQANAQGGSKLNDTRTSADILKRA